MTVLGRLFKKLSGRGDRPRGDAGSAASTPPPPVGPASATPATAAPPPPPPPPPAVGPASVTLVLEDGTTATPDLDRETEERLRYIVDNIVEGRERPST